MSLLGIRIKAKIKAHSLISVYLHPMERTINKICQLSTNHISEQEKRHRQYQMNNPEVTQILIWNAFRCVDSNLQIVTHVSQGQRLTREVALGYHRYP